MKLFWLRIRLDDGQMIKAMITARNKDEAMSRFSEKLELYYPGLSISDICCFVEMTEDNEFVVIGDGKTMHYSSIYKE